MKVTKTRFVFSFFIFAIVLNLTAQENGKPLVKQALYLEALGIGGFGSINYERSLLIKSLHQINGRIGFSTLNTRDFTNTLNPDFIFPIAINWLYGKNHKLEIGFGQAITNIVVASSLNGQPTRVTKLNANFNLGYRYQKSTGGFLFRCGYTPIYEHYENYRHWAGVSFGYAFKIKE